MTRIMQNFNYHYLWWPLVAIIYYATYTYVSKQVNTIGGKWMIVSYVMGICFPLWLIVSRVQKNILFDGMLYDNILTLTYIATMIYLGEANSFGSMQWAGLILVIIGSVLIKIQYRG